MFGKKLSHELLRYFRRLWHYALLLVIVSVFAFLIIYFDKNAVEITGLVTAIGLFVICALAFFIHTLIHAFKSFSENLSSALPENSQLLKKFLWAQITAFMIFMMIAALLIFACVSIFARESVGSMFSAFGTDWYYFLEFVFYIIIFFATLYIVPTTQITAFRLGKHKTIALLVEIIVFTICFFFYRDRNTFAYSRAVNRHDVGLGIHHSLSRSIRCRRHMHVPANVPHAENGSDRTIRKTQIAQRINYRYPTSMDIEELS